VSLPPQRLLETGLLPSVQYRFRSLTGLIDDFRADIRRLVGDRYA
jgi:hypothetical protein